jgi:uncharacterized protein (TIGR00369 family)
MTSPPRPAAARGAERAPDPDVEQRVRESFDRQQFMHTLGARLIRVAPGEIDIELPVRPELGQQNGFVHAGAVTAVADSACGYAAMSLTPPDADILSIEFKINLLAPATGDRLVARARVVRSGRRITVCTAEVAAESPGSSRTVAIMQATMMTLAGTPSGG